jgi:enterobactin synthetase component D
MSMVEFLDGGYWVRPPAIFGPHVHARATRNLNMEATAIPGMSEARFTKRSREIAVGRFCAAQALRDAGSNDLTVGVGAHREPRWPPGFVGSITHSPSFACAAIALDTDIRGLGIDSEPIFDDAAMNDAAPLALDANEKQLIEGPRKRELATLIFSAKESLFKCLYPLTGVFFEFIDARIEWIAHTKPSSGAFGVQLLRNLSSTFGRGLRLKGRYARGGDHVHTALELPP